MKRSPDLTLTGLQVALTHWVDQEKTNAGSAELMVFHKAYEQERTQVLLIHLHKSAILQYNIYKSKSAFECREIVGGILGILATYYI